MKFEVFDRLEVSLMWRTDKGTEGGYGWFDRFPVDSKAYVTHDKVKCLWPHGHTYNTLART